VQGGSAVSQSSIETLLWSAYPPGSSSTRAYLCLFSANAWRLFGLIVVPLC